MALDKPEESTTTLHTMPLEDFKAFPMPEAWESLVIGKKADLFKDCRSFSECHIRVRQETGLWIEELVPVFEKLDASLAKIR
ncbi:MAG: hypothetical protein U9Q81_23205 [Pseudomonadota bacterium]|nr:hypothetical protein [Pseudomonadota bacterium]